VAQSEADLSAHRIRNAALFSAGRAAPAAGHGCNLATSGSGGAGEHGERAALPEETDDPDAPDGVGRGFRDRFIDRPWIYAAAGLALALGL
jgi:hypothetical protein